MSRLIDKVNELIASNMSRAEVLDRMEGFFEQAENNGSLSSYQYDSSCCVYIGWGVIYTLIKTT